MKCTIEDPLYHSSLGNDGKWYVDGPGYELNFYGGHLHKGHRCDSKWQSLLCVDLALAGYKFGYHQFQLQMQQLIGLAVEDGAIVDDKTFLYKPERDRESVKWYVASSRQLLKQIEFSMRL